MNYFENIKDFSPEAYLGEINPLKVNNHLHTPFSFSAFSSVEEALDQAVEENVQVVGVNDFYTFEAYEQWSEGAFKRGLFPLFNVEFIGINQEDKKKGFLINDPSNPGRIYISGKSIAYPSILSAKDQKILDDIMALNNKRSEEMTSKLNDWFKEVGFGYELDFNDIKSNLTNGHVRERHLALAVRLLAEKHYHYTERLLGFYLILFGNKCFESNLHSSTGMENEIRSALLKAGKPAYVEESQEAFADSSVIKEIILKAGGVPTYPFLADAVKGYTVFERELHKVVVDLRRRNIYSVELIPTRNSIQVLKEYATYLRKNGFVVSFGTEHNSPGQQPIEVKAKGGVQLTDELKQINYEGACILAAHQYLFAKEGRGILDESGAFIQERRQEFFQLGNALIKHVTCKKEFHGVD
ncbi:PHP domain-containing protein [Carboxylicivirga sp. RSCT41]|uniref:PHP domain-containing protein n=1 Tax=Carboxylicivirga agarovorans TaxID=3417570 RepID=UPI003D354AEA